MKGRDRACRLAVAPRSRVGDCRSEGRRRVPIGRRRRDLAADERRLERARAGVVLQPHHRRPAGRRHGLRADARDQQVDRRRPHVPDGARGALRQPRPVDCARRSAAHDQRQRRRRRDLVQWRPDLDDAAEPADRRSSTTSSPTTSFRIASTARSRTARRCRSPAGPAAAGSTRPTGTRSAAARAATSPRIRATRTSSMPAPTTA